MKNLSINKKNFIEQFVKDNELVKCLKNPQKNFLDYEVNDPASIIFENLYPCKYIPAVDETSKAFIAMEFIYEPPRNNSQYFRVSNITFYIFCHFDLIQTDYETLRYDYALQHVDEIMQNARSKEWIGKMEFAGCKDVIMDQRGQYVGVAVSYRSVDFT